MNIVRLLGLLLLACFAGNTHAAAYYRLEQVSQVTAGEMYVFEQDGYVMSNTVNSGELLTVALAKTTGLTGSESYVWRLVKDNNGFRMKNVSKSMYLYNSNSTTLALHNSNYTVWTFLFNDGVAQLKKYNEERSLAYTNQTTHHYKAFVDVSALPHDIVVYRLVEVDYTVTALSNNENYGTVSVSDHVITASPKAGYRVSTTHPYEVTAGAATVTQSGNEFSVEAEDDCTVTINFEPVPRHTFSFVADGITVCTTLYEEGNNVVFPDAPADVAGKSFVGWTASAIDGTADEKPSMVSTATMGIEDVTLYAVYADVESSSVSAVFDASDLSSMESSARHATGWVDAATGIELWMNTGVLFQGSLPYYFAVYYGNTNYIEVNIGGSLSRVVATVTDATHAVSGVSTGSLVTDGQQQTVTFDAEVAAVRCFAPSWEQLRVTKVVVDGVVKSESGFCTTVTTTVPVTISAAAGYAAYGAERTTDFSSTGITVFTARCDGTNVWLSEVADGVVPAGEGVVLYMDTDDDVTVSVPVSVGDGSLALPNNDLLVSDGTVEGDGQTIYALSKKSSGVGFYRVKSGVQVPRSKPYLVVPAAGSREFFGFDNETTAVSSVKLGTTKGTAYGLDGLPVRGQKRGTVLVKHNGKYLIR